jgi:carbonic anhydrase
VGLRKLLIAGALALICAAPYAQETGRYVSPWRTPWDYEGPRGAEHWSQLDPEYAPCNGGREQSPVDIRDPQKANLPVLRFQSRERSLDHVINNGHTIRVNYRRGNGNLLAFGDQRYELTQFHFHHPAEETIPGRSWPMEAHLMYATSDGKLAAVTVFVRPGRPNSTVEKLWKHMPASEGWNEASGVTISPGGLLPPDLGSYYVYTGSVSAPPCTEGVTWFVLKEPIELSRAQIDVFAKLYPNDARPIQPLNGRAVRERR